MTFKTESGSVQSGELRICYQCFDSFDSFDKGDGEKTIVLVHGWGSSLQANWVDTGWVESLTPCRRVVGLDVRGHGDSDKPLSQSLYSYVAMGADVLAVMDHLGLEEADYLGYSMGAFMGAALLASHPKRFRSMILGGIGDESDTSLACLPDIVAGLRADSPGDLQSPLSRGYRNFVDGDLRNDRACLALSAAQMWPEGFALRLVGPAARDIQTPVLIVNGELDEPYVSSAQALVDELGNAQQAIIPGCDHLTTITDRRFKDTVNAFLA